MKPQLLTTPYRLWIKTGEKLGWLNTRIILTILYFTAVLPVAVILRLSGKTPLKLKFDPQADSYREQPEENSDSTLKDQY